MASIQNGCDIEHTGKGRGRLHSYVVALRPWSFTVTLCPVTLGSVIAYKSIGDFNIWIFIVTCLTSLSVHAAGNLVNTYYDYMKGIDSKKSDDRTLVDHILTPDDVMRLGTVFYVIGCLGFAMLTFFSNAKMEHLALVYFGGLSSSFLYTGGPGLKYVALGDIVIFLTFGPLTVFFAYLTQGGVLCEGGSLCFTPLIYAIPLALNTEAILHSNNTRDMETDRAAGIITLANLIGHTGSYILFTLLIFTPYIIFAILSLHFSRWFVLPLVTILPAFRYEKEFREGKMHGLPTRIAKLNLQLGLAYILAFLLSSKEVLPGLS